MWTFRIYGLLSTKKEEKEIMTGVNNYLQTISRTTSKTKNKSLLDSRLPFVYKHFYWNLNKETKTWLEIFPNADLNEKCFDEKNTEYSWILKVLFHDDIQDYDYAMAENFIDCVLKSTSKNYKLLQEGKE